MASERLLELFKEFDAQHIERVFGREVFLRPPDPALKLAPVKRVAIITEAFLPKVDGVTKSAFLTMLYLRQTGREVLVFAPDIAPDHVGDTRVVKLASVAFPKVPETRMALPNPIIARQIHDFKPDLIHMFSPALMSVSGMATGRHLNIPIVANYQTDLPGYTEHYGVGFLENLTRNWLRYVHNGCHVTLAPSQHTINDLRRHGFKRLRRWGRGVNSDRFDPRHATHEWREKLLHGRDPNSMLCIYVGRLATEKRVEQLIEVARTPGVALTIIGDGAEREHYESLFRNTNAHFTGYLLGDDLPAAFASADAFVFTGPNETFGQVIQEAMASGLPAVVTNQGGVKDLVLEGETGFVVEPYPMRYAEAVKTLRDDPNLRLQMARRAREIAQNHPWERILAELEDHYTEAYEVNERFKRIFGATDYHRPLRIPRELMGIPPR